MTTINTILAFETSCDETAVAIVNRRKEILANVVFSQLADHEVYGGVVPEIAARKHLQKIPQLLNQALEHIGLQDVDAIAATTGPGLIGGVLVGMSLAKALAFGLHKPFIPVNHLAGHALVARLTDAVELPYLLLLVSGGHSQFVIVKGPYEYVELGTTRDDAVGETFDKTAKLLGLPYPGGPALEKLAALGNPHAFVLPKPLYKTNSCELSLSGLKTAVRQLIQAHAPLSDQTKADIAASFQKTICDLLVERTQKALQMAQTHIPNLKTFVLSGGVAANQTLRQSLDALLKQMEVNCVYPPIRLCTDNAVMIAWAALESVQTNVTPHYQAAARPRWPLHELKWESL